MDQTIKDSVAWLKDLAHPGAHLRLDSREVKPGDIFCAVPGEKVDGRTYPCSSCPGSGGRDL